MGEKAELGGVVVSEQANKPNLLLIGFPRCGTTALAATLSKDPQIFVCDPKEPHFLAFSGEAPDITGPGSEAFSSGRVYDLDSWKKIYENRDHQYLVDASVTTVSYPQSAIENIEKYCALDTRVLVMLRDPVDRAYSSYLYNLSRGWEAGTFEAGLSEESHRREENWQHLWFFRWLSLYEDRMKPFEAYFGLDNLCYLSAEEFSDAPNNVLKKVSEFLELPKIDVDTSNTINSGGAPKSKLLRDITVSVRRHPIVHKLARSVTTQAFRESLRNKNLSKPVMNESTRLMLDTEFTETRRWMSNRLQQLDQQKSRQ